MAATELQPKVVSANDENIPNEEARSTCPPPRLGGWITFPFVSVTLFGSMLASSGLFSNLIVYLIGQFNINSIDAAQISNIVSGCTNLLPIAGAIIADSFLGNFTVIAITSFISLLGTILLMLTATVHSLKPAHCGTGSCSVPPPLTLQYAALYTALVMSTLGFGGQRFTIAAMGADQFEKPKEHAIFFNWYFIIFYGATTIGGIAIVYIQDNIGWSLGYGICVAANVIGIVVFLSGKRSYHDVKPKGSPFTRLARVVVATVKKRKVSVSSDAKAYYYGCSTDSTSTSPTSSFRFLNRAAIKTEGDTNELDGSLSKPWRLCTVQQVEDFKTLIRIFPLWSSSIFLSIPIGIQYSVTVLQALTMDRHIGHHFKIPASTIVIFNLITTVIFLVLIDRFLFTTYQKLTRRSLTPFQRIGVGHIFNILGMATSALVESRRLHVAQSHNLVDKPNSIIVPLSALWLIVPLAVTGIGEAFHFPGQVVLYYEEFPKSLKSTSTAMIAMLVAVGFYLSTAVIDLVRRLTGWLPNNINKGRVDNVFWFLVVIGVINFGYYLICATLYKYQNQNVEKSSVDNDDQQ